jgi:ribosomal protein L37E
MPDRDPDLQTPRPAAGTPASPARPRPELHPDAVACERCGAEMYRMHAVWRCSECGFKTDCCGW